MDSVPPDKRVPFTHNPSAVGVDKSHDQSNGGAGNGETDSPATAGGGGAAVSSLIHLPPHQSHDQCEVSHMIT